MDEICLLYNFYEFFQKPGGGFDVSCQIYLFNLPLLKYIQNTVFLCPRKISTPNLHRNILTQSPSRVVISKKKNEWLLFRAWFWTIELASNKSTHTIIVKLVSCGYMVMNYIDPTLIKNLWWTRSSLSYGDVSLRLFNSLDSREVGQVTRHGHN